MPEIIKTLDPTITAVIVAFVTSVVTSFFAQYRYREENRQRFQAERIARRLLNYKSFQLRSFEKLSKRIGGFTDDELRQILVRAGAVRYYSRAGREFWGLQRRTRHLMHGDRIERAMHKSLAAESSEEEAR